LRPFAPLRKGIVGFTANKNSAGRSVVVVRAEESKESGEVSKEEGEDEPPIYTGGTMKLKAKKPDLTMKDAVNPYNLGQKSRQLFDDVWTRVNQLGGIMNSPVDEEIDRVLIGGAMCEYEVPMAKFTTVLVVGVTGRVGRILVRKLLLRGYTVKALVRPHDMDVMQNIPSSVEVIVGDVGEPKDAARALSGCNKVVYCAGARSTATADLFRVDQVGVYNLTKALQDQNNAAAQKRSGISFKSKRQLFDIKRNVGAFTANLHNRTSAATLAVLGARDRAKVEINDKGYVELTSNVATRGAYAEMIADIPVDVIPDLVRYDGFVLRVCGDGKPYQVQIHCKPTQSPDSDGEPVESIYTARFNARPGWQTVRIPYQSFIPKIPGDPPLDVRSAEKFAIVYESRRLPRNSGSTDSEADMNKSKLMVHYIKLVPRGEEPDFLLVSCTGVRDVELPEDELANVLMHKARGEAVLRNSGLGYSIIRPGALIEEPGGQRALVFDQGGRIAQSISCADVADVCLRGLHDLQARNKSYEVCYEYKAEEGSLYELIAHLPDKSNNYLTSALSSLEVNT